MKNKKPILFILLTVLGLIIAYNYMIVPSLTQYNYGMGMHMRFYTNNNSLIDVQWIIILILIIVGFLLYEILKPKEKSNKCSSCGKVIEDDRWKVCPLCGEPINIKKG